MTISYAALSQPLSSVGNEIQLLPDGVFRARDGRPAGLAGWRLDAAAAQRLVDAVAARATPMVIDYEHQTLNAETNGQPAPAAGWFTRMAYRPGLGLYATDVQWTERARAHIAAGEYKFISPVFGYEAASGEIREMQMAALTNNPALDGMAAVAALTSRFSTGREAITPEDQPMKAIAKLLGLAEDADEAAISAAVVALNAQVAEQTAALTASATELAQLKTETAALKTAKPNPAEYVPVAALTALQADLAALKKTQHDGEVAQLVEAALTAGKLVPALADWARELGGNDIAALRSYLDKAAPIAALGAMQTRGRVPGSSDAENDPGTVAQAALKYQHEQAALGTVVSTTAAVDHVLAKKGGAQ